MVVGLIVLLTLQIISLVGICTVRKDLTDRVATLERQTFLYKNQADYNAQQLSLSVIPGSDKLYMPELNLSVPSNEVTRHLLYSYTPGDNKNPNGEVRMYSANALDYKERVQSCLDVIRLKIEPTPNAYSPDQPLYKTVSLADGAKLQIYTSNLKECAQIWQQVSPLLIADNLAQAQLFVK